METQSAIETVSQIAKGANQALSYENYENMITALNAMSNVVLKKGQNIYIGTVGVPDLWVFSVEETSSTYTFVDDGTLVNLLKENVAVQIGYYKIAMLETQKVDLSGYAKTSDVELLDSISLKLAIHKLFLNANNNQVVDLPLNGVYLVIVANTYNVGSCWIVQTGASVGTALVKTIFENSYFTAKASAQSQITITSETASGYCYVWTLGTMY